MKKITFILLMFISASSFGQSLPLDFESPEDDNFVGFNGTIAMVIEDPTDATNNVLEMVGAGVDFDGASINLDTYIDLSDDSDNTISFEIWAEDGSTRTHLLKLEGGSSGATELFFETNMAGWQTVNVDFGAGLGTEYPVLTIFTDSGAGNTATGTYYIDDIDGPNGAMVPVVSEPDTPAPVPTAPDADTYSIYNDTNGYSNAFTVQYAFGTLGGEPDLDPGAGENKALQFNFAVAGWGQGEALDDVSSYDTFSFDYWALPGTPGFNIELISNDGGVTGYIYEYGSNESIVTGEWVSVTLPMTVFTDQGFGDTAFFQWKFDPYQQSVANGGVVYVDNILLTRNDALSTNDLSLTEFSIGPNPTNDIWTIRSQQVINSVEVFDLLGKEVISIQPSDLQAEVDSNGLKAGIYLARISGAQGTKTVKLVKN